MIKYKSRLRLVAANKLIISMCCSLITGGFISFDSCKAYENKEKVNIIHSLAPSEAALIEEMESDPFLTITRKVAELEDIASVKPSYTVKVERTLDSLTVGIDPSLDPKAAEMYTSIALIYGRDRLMGHSIDYALADSKYAAKQLVENINPFLQVLLPSHPEWGNDEWMALRRGPTLHEINPRFSPDAGQSFSLIDGDLAYVYSVRKFATDQKYEIVCSIRDTQEDDPKLKPIFDEAVKACKDMMASEGIAEVNREGPPLWSRMKKWLKEKYRIDWLSPDELNPNTNFD